MPEGYNDGIPTRGCGVSDTKNYSTRSTESAEISSEEGPAFVCSAHSRPGYNEETAVLLNLGVNDTTEMSRVCGAEPDSTTDEGGVTAFVKAKGSPDGKPVGTGAVEKGHVDPKSLAKVKGGYLL